MCVGGWCILERDTPWKEPKTSDLGKSMGLGYPPRVWTDKQAENITSPILRMRVVKMTGFRGVKFM